MSLTIEFAGITTLVWHKAKGEAEVILIDLEKAGYERHQAALGMPPRIGVVAPEPDTSIAVPGRPMELAIWGLKGTQIEVRGGDTGPLRVAAGEIKSAEPPPPVADSIYWLPEIGELSGSKSVSKAAPIAARMRVRSGRITATAAAHPQIRGQFISGGRELGPLRYFLPRFILEIDGTDISLCLDAHRTLEFPVDHTVIISNTCACKPLLAGDPARDHFNAHYLVAEEPQRRPTIQARILGNGPTGLKAFAIPPSPDQCFSAFFLVP